MKENKFKIYCYFLREFRRKLAFFLFYSFSLSTTQALLIVALYPFISYSLDQGVSQGNAGFVLENIKTLISISPISDPFLSASILLIVIGIAQGAFRYLSVAASLDLSYGITHSLQKRMYERVMNSDIDYFVHTKQGDIIFQLKDPPIKVGYVIRGSAVFIRELLTTMFLLFIMGSINFKLTLLVLGVGMIFGIVVKLVTQKVIYHAGVASTKALGDEDVILAESLGGIHTIKAFLGERRWIKIFVDKVTEFVQVTKKLTLIKEIPVATLEVVIIILIAVSAIVFKALYTESFIAFMPVFSVFAVSIFKMIPSLRNLSNAGMNIVSLFFNLELCYNMLHKTAATIANGKNIFPGFKKSIEFKNVHFTYPGEKNAVFEGVSFTMECNKIIALAGQSGSGKTTAIKLLLRFYDIHQGSIEIDGVNLKDLERSSWLEKIGYVSQDPFIFHATIEENISFGRLCHHEDVVQAARLAGAHEFISRIENGYQAIVGEKGMKLSGGEKQRIAIARAILKNPEILIFDEATSALDAKTETLVQNTITQLASSCTVILIAHRSSTLKIADKVLVFSKGKLLEQGTPTELLKGESYFSKINNLNFA